MTVEEEILKVNSYFDKGLKNKDIARISDDNIDFFKIAAESYSDAAKLLDKIIEGIESSKENFLTRCISLREYYYYEAFECLYNYENKSDHYDKAIENAKEAQQHILNALNNIETNFSKLNKDTQEYLSEMKVCWTLNHLSIQTKLIEPVAKRAFKSTDFITSMDNYRKMNELQDAVFKYVNESKELDEVYKRIERANYIASKASIANSIAGIYIKKNGNYSNEILEQFLIALENLKKAKDINPEWDKFKVGEDITKKNISKVLKDNRKDWDKFYYNFESNEQLKIIMKEIDVLKYRDIEIKRKLNDPQNKTSKLIIFGGFWLSALLIIMASITTLFLLKIHWSIVILIILLVQLVYALFSATVLRNLGDLSEKGLIDIYKFTIRLNFNMFNKNKPELDKSK